MREPQSPSGPTPEAVRLSPARAENARALYVINLTASNMPMPLEMPNVRGFFGLAVFRSRRIEDGRDRYRLHLGYFESRADAERALPAVQRRYPTAWIAAAPRSGLGSLDDTNVSEFKLIHPPARTAQPDLATATPPERAAPGEIPVAAPQRFVVQLVWSDQRVDPNQIAHLAIFDAYTMYTVTVLRGGVRYYGIRLGFFTSVISARQIALYVRSEFQDVAVVPVSSREYDVARTIAWHRDARTVVNAGSDSEQTTASTHASVTTDATPVEVPDRLIAASPRPETLPAEPVRTVPPQPPPPIIADAEPVPATTDAPPAPEPERQSILEPLRVVSARLVQTDAPSTDVREMLDPASVEVPQSSVQEPPPPAPKKSATMRMREEAQRRGPVFSQEELLAALRATERSSHLRRFDTQAPHPFSGVTPARRESAIRRFWHRLMG